MVLYHVVTAGDYRAVYIANDGQAEFTRYNRSYTIISRKQGQLQPEQVDVLFDLAGKLGFFDLDEEYPRPSSGPQFEDIYNWVEVFDGRQIRSVVAHEYASPPQLDEMVQALFDIASQLPDVQQPGTYLMAVSHDVLPYLRLEVGMPSLEPGPQNIASYSPLEKALLNPGSLVPISDPTSSQILELYASEWHMIEVTFDNRQYIVLLLIQE